MQLPYLLIWCSPVHHPILLWQGKGVQFQVNPTPLFLYVKVESGVLCASLVKQLPFLCLIHFEALIVDRFWPSIPFFQRRAFAVYSASNAGG